MRPLRRSTRDGVTLLLAAALAFGGSAAMPAAGRALHAVLVVLLGAAGVLLAWMGAARLLAGRDRRPD